MQRPSLLGALWFVTAFAGLFIPAGNAKLLDSQRLEPMPELPSGEGNTGFGPGAVFPTTDTAALSKWSETFGSFLESDASTGRYESPWLAVSDDRVVLGVAGYPSVEQNSLAVEVLLADDTRSRIAFAGANPAEQWVRWAIDVPAKAKAVRVIAIDQSTGRGGWLGITTPRRETASVGPLLSDYAKLACTFALAWLLLLGPGLAIRSWRGTDRVDLTVLLVAGPAILVVLGTSIWALAKVVPPAAFARSALVFELLILGLAYWRKGFRSACSEGERAVLGLMVLAVAFGAVRANYFGGPAGELYGGTISRSLEVGGRSDSRISFHIVQMVANGLAPEDEQAKLYFLPFEFTSRGPLAGLASAPLAIAVGQPPLSFEESAWSPFDKQGYAAYRISMMSFAALSLLALYACVRRLANGSAAFLAVGIVALSPFFLHEVYFTWPKLLATAFVVFGFDLLCARSPVKAGFALAVAYLCHPGALLSVPFLGLWALGTSEGSAGAWPRILRATRFTAPMVVIGLAWWLVNGQYLAQGGFVEYFKMAEQVPSAPAPLWLASRWNNLANTLIPLHLLILHSDNSQVNSVFGPSNFWVHLQMQFWMTLPFGLGLPLFFLMFPLAAHAARQAPRAFLMLVGAPFLFLVLYWGFCSTGLLREAGHAIFLALAGIVGWGWAQSRSPRVDRLVALIVSVPFLSLRVTALLVMAFAATLEHAPWWSSGRWRVNDALSLIGSIAVLVLIAVLVRREHYRGAQREGPSESLTSRSSETSIQVGVASAPTSGSNLSPVSRAL